MKFFIVSILLIFQPISYACDAHKKEAGFKYESMKADTVYEKIGLKNGDLIQKYDNKKVKRVPLMPLKCTVSLIKAK